ncbi:EI24 domain-containing protein [Thermodesulfobacteriota bacterium]
MNLFSGILYNLRGLRMGLKTPRLLFLGFIRFAAVIILTVAAAVLLFKYHYEILDQIWTQPESRWVLWLWHLLSWLLTLFLLGLSAVFAFLVCQILFSIFIMDRMSQITERMVSGEVKSLKEMPVFRQLVHLIKQEIPRATLPVVLMCCLSLVGWLTPFGAVIAIITSLIAAVFLAWDHTDLVLARRLTPFPERFKFLLKNLPFHLGFGIVFLIPVLNILFLSFAPVGGTLYYINEYELKNR